MSKYINADTIIQALRETIDKHKDSEMFTRSVRAAENMIRIIDKMPAADVAEVVYCKDCKHRDKDDICTELDTYGEGSVMAGDYFFCGAGERKEQNED